MRERPRAKHVPARLLFLTSDLGMGGAERHAVSIVTGLDRSKVATRLQCVERRGERFEEVVSADVAADSFDAEDRWWLSVPRLVRQLRGVIREFDPDVLMTNGFSAEVLGRLAGRGTGVRLYTWKHNVGHVGGVGRRDRISERLLGRYSHHYLAVSHRQVDYLVEALGIDRTAVKVIHNAVRPFGLLSPAQRAELRDELGIPSGAVVVLCVAGFRVEKDHPTLLEAFRRVREVRADAHLCLVGDGPERRSVESLARDLGLSEWVTFTGNREDAERIVQVGAVAVLASYAIENFPLSILEAMSAGVPAVCTDVGGLPEMIEQGVTGKLVPARDPESLADAILWVLEPSRVEALGAAARERLTSRFPFDLFLSQVEEVILDGVNP